MRAQIDSPERFSAAAPSEIKVIILYEDFTSGTRGKNFAECLAERLGSPCHLSESLWRCALLASPGIAADAARAAADCDYLILSLRGDHDFHHATLRWIEPQLDGAAARGAAVIALVDFGGETRGEEAWRAAGGARRHLRSMCAEKGIPFF